VLEEPRRLAEARVDGPGLAGCQLAMADVAHAAGDAATARRCVQEALDSFYEPTNVPNGLSWLHLMAGHDALALGEEAAVRHHLARSRAAFVRTGDLLGPACCDALELRLGGANGALTAR
jgi:hypothetical protein